MKLLALVMACLVPLVAVAADPKDDALGASDWPTQQQAELDCRMYGLAGGILGQDRDASMTSDAAVADVQANFARFDVSKPHNHHAVAYALRSLQDEAKWVYGMQAYKPKTLLYALPVVCAANMARKPDDKHMGLFLVAARGCQDAQPPPLPSQDLRTRDDASDTLRGCIEHNVAMLYDK